MSTPQRLRLDSVITSMPELGPMIPDGGYSWLVLLGIVTVQITVPSILAVYGVVLGYLNIESEPDIGIWTGSMTLTPILFTACWSLTDPWSRTIVGLATIPRLVGVIGVVLLSIGILASGYLSTGGVGAYLARISAGAVMGIGASLVSLQSEHLLRKYFRSKLIIAIILKNVGFSIGMIVVPIYAYILLTRTGLQTGILLFATILFPAILGTCTFDTPILAQGNHYSLLLSEEDNELNINGVRPDVTNTGSENAETNQESSVNYDDAAEISDEGPPPLFGGGSDTFAYYEPDDDDVNLFVQPVARTGIRWSDEVQILKRFKFWNAVIAWLGMKSCAVSLLVFSPAIGLTEIQSFATLEDVVILLVTVGLGTLLPNIASYWNPKTARWRSIYFGSMCWLGAAVLVGLVFSDGYAVFLCWAFMGGISMGGCAVSQESALRDLLGDKNTKYALTPLCIVVGAALLSLIFIKSFSICLQVTAIVQFLGGSYWVLSPLLGAIQARFVRR